MKKLSKKKSFDKISITDITNLCGIKRQTFYYHFQDKYELVNWIYYHEIIEVVEKNNTVDHWSQNLLKILNIIKKDCCFYQSVLNSNGQNNFEDYILDISKDMFLNVIDILTKGEEFNLDYKTFVASFYSYGMVGIIKSWAKNGMREEPQTIVQYLEKLVLDVEKLVIKYHFQKK